jgi:hypothetical protein
MLAFPYSEPASTLRHRARNSNGLVAVPQMSNNDDIPDVRDGLTRKERIVLYVLHQTQKERGDHNVPTPMLWGRVCEYFYISPEELSKMLARLGAMKY